MELYFVLKQFAGSRGAAVNLEGRSISTWSTPRHCIVTRLKDLTIDMYRNVRSKAGALIVELPESVSNITQEEKQVIILIKSRSRAVSQCLLSYRFMQFFSNSIFVALFLKKF